MVSAYAASFADLFLAVTALELFSFLDAQTGAGTTASARAPLLAGAASRRLSGLFISALCASVGTLEYVLYVQESGGADRGALGLAALRALPAAATAAFFLGMMLIVVAHVRAGGEGGGGASAGVEPVQGPVRVLTNMAFGAAAPLVFLMAMATIHGAK